MNMICGFANVTNESNIKKESKEVSVSNKSENCYRR